MCRSAFSLIVIACFALFAASVANADSLPVYPEIDRNPQLKADRQPAIGRTIAAGCVLTAVALGTGILARAMRLKGQLGKITATAIALVWIGALGFAGFEWLRAAREQAALTSQAERDWAKWEEEKREYRRHRHRPPSKEPPLSLSEAVPPLEQPLPAPPDTN
jgi:hypothetical protein